MKNMIKHKLILLRRNCAELNIISKIPIYTNFSIVLRSISIHYHPLVGENKRIGQHPPSQSQFIVNQLSCTSITRCTHQELWFFTVACFQEFSIFSTNLKTNVWVQASQKLQICGFLFDPARILIPQFLFFAARLVDLV